MANKEKDVIEVKGVILESLPNAMFLVELETSPPPHHRPSVGQDAQEQHPDTARRQDPAGGIAV